MPRGMTMTLWAVSAAALIILGSAPAQAGPGSGGGGGSGGSVGDVLTAYVHVTSGGGGSGSCEWDRVDGTLSAGSNGSVTWPREADGITYLLYRRTCADGVDWLEVPDLGPGDLLPLLLDRLRERNLPKPTPTFEMLDPVNNWAYVTVPLDFRAGANSWRNVSVTASIGPIWATVTAQPVRLTFDPGDPGGMGAVTCDGFGPVASYVPEVPGACSYTYTNASSTSTYDGYHFLTTMTIDWAISWTSSTGAGGVLEPYSTSSTAPLAVAEVKGLVSCTGSRDEQGGC